MSNIIESQCPECGKGLFINPEFQGKEVKCEFCNQEIMPLKITSDTRICFACRNIVSKTAETCPQCGQKFKSNFSFLRVILMVLWIIIGAPLLLVLLGLFIGGIAWCFGFLILAIAKK